MSKTCDSCTSSDCSAKNQNENESMEAFLERQQLEQRLCAIKHKIVVMSGKGGVGKSTVASNLAAGLAGAGFKTGLLDIDIHGPSIPTLFGLTGQRMQQNEEGLLPVQATENLKVMSIAFGLEDSDQALIWRGPMKIGVITQLLRDVAWGELDYLVVDVPPGTGDEPLTICQLIPDMDGAVVVTTPQEMAAVDVRKSINFCRKLDIPVLGVIENMSGFKCPCCNTVTEIFKSGGGEKMAADFGVPFLGKLPIDPAIAHACDSGAPHIGAEDESVSATALRSILEKITAGKAETTAECVRIAVPVADGQLAMHFGHCQQFRVYSVENGTVTGQEELTPPPHEPGVIPKFLKAQNVNSIIAGGMGTRAQELFAGYGIEVITGASGTPDEIVAAHLAGTLETGINACEH